MNLVACGALAIRHLENFPPMSGMIAPPVFVNTAMFSLSQISLTDAMFFET